MTQQAVNQRLSQMAYRDVGDLRTNDRQVRVEALRLAIGVSGVSGGEIELARRYADFLLGTNDAEILDVARELAKKVG
jgi:hypothetical protein